MPWFGDERDYFTLDVNGYNGHIMLSLIKHLYCTCILRYYVQYIMHVTVKLN